MRLEPKVVSNLRETIQRYFPHPEYKVALFGSYAKGTARASSDIDLAVIGRAPLNLAHWQLLISELEESDIPQKVDVIDFHRVTEDFQKIITEEGIDFYADPLEA